MQEIKQKNSTQLRKTHWKVTTTQNKINELEDELHNTTYQKKLKRALK